MGGPGQDDALGDPDGGGGGIFADINITPLTDIFLVLLVIFMVTTTAIQEQERDGGFEVNLPRAGAAEDRAEIPRNLSIAILQDGRTVVGGAVVSDEELRARLDAARGGNPDTLVLVQADEGVAHGRVVAVMDLARRAGLSKLAIATRAEDGAGANSTR